MTKDKIVALFSETSINYRDYSIDVFGHREKWMSIQSKYPSKVCLLNISLQKRGKEIVRNVCYKDREKWVCIIWKYESFLNRKTILCYDIKWIFRMACVSDAFFVEWKKILSEIITVFNMPKNHKLNSIKNRQPLPCFYECQKLMTILTTSTTLSIIGSLKYILYPVSLPHRRP